MTERTGIFAGDDPFQLTRDWMAEAAKTEPNDPNAIALGTVGPDGMPNVRIVLLKEIEADAFVFYTNYESQKAQEIDHSGKVGFVLFWKTLGRQVRVRGLVEKEDGPQADAYFASRHELSRQGAWASKQSRILVSRESLMSDVEAIANTEKLADARPPHWGGFRIRPTEFEFWSNGDFRLHDRFRWTRSSPEMDWKIDRLYP